MNDEKYLLGTVYDGCLNIKYRLSHRKLKKNKTICYEKKLSFLFSDPAFDTIQLINSVKELMNLLYQILF